MLFLACSYIPVRTVDISIAKPGPEEVDPFLAKAKTAYLCIQFFNIAQNKCRRII
jgi:hypothetical protein